MLIIGIAKKKKITGGHIGIMLIIENTKIEFTGSHTGNILILEITKLDLTGSYANYRDC